ncbi:MAG: N-acetyltransferase YodP [Candidatus Dichloromethanomonas elyunquensis]|nr:MAG: N-acetyltransferase YodP [Candidatus Dichloromethanomonas elyunquensis]
MLKTLNPEYNLNHIVLDQRNKRMVVNGYALGTIVSVFSYELIILAINNHLEKIWLWALPADVPIFLRQGFFLEGSLYRGNEEEFSVSLAYYVCKSRARSVYLDAEKRVLHSIKARPLNPLLPLPAGMKLKLLDESFSSEISQLLTKVFSSYPSPVENPEYLRSLFRKGRFFAGVIYRENLIAVAAAYPNLTFNRCEMTDCATLEEYRGYSLTQHLLTILEYEIKKKSALILYTLVRAQSLGMNRVFHKLGYQYQGRLINNCYICSAYEDMNLWAKFF